MSPLQSVVGEEGGVTYMLSSDSLVYDFNRVTSNCSCVFVAVKTGNVLALGGALHCLRSTEAFN